MKEFEYISNPEENGAEGLLRIFVRSKSPNPKGVRAKGQKFMHSKGVDDSMLWLIGTIDVEGGSICVMEVFSPKLRLKRVTGIVTEGVTL